MEARNRRFLVKTGPWRILGHQRLWQRLRLQSEGRIGRLCRFSVRMEDVVPAQFSLNFSDLRLSYCLDPFRGFVVAAVRWSSVGGSGRGVALRARCLRLHRVSP